MVRGSPQPFQTTLSTVEACCVVIWQDEAKSAFDEWLKVKREQRKKEAKKEQEQQEKDVSPDTKKRSRREAEKAFKKYADRTTQCCFSYEYISTSLQFQM